MGAENRSQDVSAALADRFRGALVGAAVGDALGAGFEGSSSVNAPDVELLDREPGPLRYTDDTHMTLGVAESLVERRGFDGAHMAALFARKFREEPWRGYGAGPPQVFDLIERGVPWDHAARSLFGGSGSFGNGAAMRVAPAALLGFHANNRVVALARQTAVITHAHELGIEGAVVQACAIARAVREGPSRSIDASAFLVAIQGSASSSVFHQKLQTARELLVVRGGGDREAVVALLGNGIEAFESVPTAIYAFLLSPSSFRDAVNYAITLGGDTDTIGSMTGALSGAYLGLSAIPEIWRERVEGAPQLVALADSLLAEARGAID